MTTRSKRRRAELAVIEAARAVRHEPLDANAVLVNQLAAGRLAGALKYLDSLGLEPPSDVRANRAAPLTSHQAAAWMKDDRRAMSVAARIVQRLMIHPGRTVEQLCHDLQGKHQTISARVNELRDTGWITADGTNRTTSGRMAECYYVTAEGRRLWRDAEIVRNNERFR